LVIIVSSHLTNSARTWLEKRRPRVPCRIHVVEGKSLKHLLLGYDDIVERYFGGRYPKLLRQSFETWSLHGLIPSFDTLSLLVKHLPIDKLEDGELVFLWCLCQFRNSEIDRWEEDTERTFPVSALVDALRPLSSDRPSILEPYQTLLLNGLRVERFGVGEHREQALVCELLVSHDDSPRVAMYGFVVFSNGQALESLVCGGSRLEATIRYLSSGGEAAFKAAKLLLDERETATRTRRTLKTDAS
jgi:hypothetical protein